jgi:uncharacterized membrane protein
MFQQDYLYWLAGFLLLIVAVMSLRDKANPRRWLTGSFWGLYGLVFLTGDWTTALLSRVISHDLNPQRTLHIIIGVLVILMALIAGCGGVRLGSYHLPGLAQRERSAGRLGNRLFAPALAIPIVTVIGVLVFDNLPALQLGLFGAGNHSTLITLFSITLGCIVGLLLALNMTRDRPLQSIQEARRLLDSIGWAFILPQILATLGLLFTSAGVGVAISHLTETYLAVNDRFIAVVVFCVGMALLTIVMGNAFAAFPIIAAGIGIPILVIQHGGNPAVMAAVGMFSGYCGSLMTPMAANFNLVPAALLELPDRYAVIKAQIPTGLALLVANILLMYFMM